MSALQDLLFLDDTEVSQTGGDKAHMEDLLPYILSILS